MADGVKAKGDGVVLTIDSVIIGQVTDLSGPNPTVDTVESTTHDSAAVSHSAVTGVIAREFLAGLLDGGELTFTVAYDPNPEYASHLKLTDLLGNFTPKDCKVEWNTIDLADWEFQGIVTGVSPSAPLGDLRTADVTVKVTGAFDSLP